MRYLIILAVLLLLTCVYSSEIPTEDERWGGVHTLSGNVIVPSSVTLDTHSSATINLNSYY